MKLRLVLIALAALVFACNAKKDDQTANPEGPPLPASATGQLIFDIPRNVDKESVKGYVVGKKDELVVVKAPNGTFYVDNIPPGNVDIVVTGTLVVTAQLTADEYAVGIRKNRVLVTAGSSSSPGALPLYPLGSLTGTVKRGGSANHEGIFVSIPGTDFGEVRTTDVDGNYSFSDVPPGHHRLLFQSSGYRDGRIEDIEVKPARSVVAEEIVLALSTGPDGSIVINDGALFSNSLSVSLALNASSDTELMIISEDINFSGLSWEPARTYRTWTFAAPGKKILYVKFADANGLETSPAKAEITIDLFSSGNAAFLPGFALNAATRPANAGTFQLSGISAPPQATSMLIYDLSTIGSAAWVAPATSGTYTYANSIASCGTHQLGVKFKTSSGDESESVEKSVTVSCWRDAPATGAPPSNSTGMSEIWTGSRLLLWGGNVNTGTIFSPNYTFWSSAYQYDAAADAWTSLPTGSQPTVYSYPGVAYAADKLFVWGGSNGSGCNQASGGVYTESTQTWTSINTTGAPSARCPAVTVAFRDPNDGMKNKVMVWSGNTTSNPTQTGAIYSITDNAWTTMGTANGPTVFGGQIVAGALGDKVYTFGGGEVSCGNGSYNFGNAYTLSTNTWAATASPGSLLTFDSCNNDRMTQGFFDGSKFYIFTSKGDTSSNTYVVKGAVYDPTANTWAALPMTNGPLNRTGFSVTYTGTKIVVLGGSGNGSDGGELPSVLPTYQADGFSFDIASQTWTRFVPYGMLARVDSKAYSTTGSGIFSWHGKYYSAGHYTSTISTLLANPP